MAVFKPTNCSPYLTAFDMLNIDNGIYYFSCKIDTSNTNIGGYSITIYDNDNNQVFPYNSDSTLDQKISLLNELKKDIILDDYYINSGLNGTYLKLPVFVDKNKYAFNLSNIDQNIIYIKDNKAYDKNNNELNISNGNSYKWIITLYQLQDNKSIPIDIKYFDMVVGTGNIIGTTKERIQTYISDNIYNDYFVQLYYAENLIINQDDLTITSFGNTQQIGSRVRIKDYDSYLGHIYPQTGQNGFSDNDIENSNILQIFKMSNNQDDLGAKDLISFSATNMFIPKFWNMSASNESVSSAEQVFYIPVSKTIFDKSVISNQINTYSIYPFSFIKAAIKDGNKQIYIYDGSKNVFNIQFNQTRVLLNSQNNNDEITLSPEYIFGEILNDSESNIDSGSKYNGIFIPELTKIYTDESYKVEIDGDDLNNYYPVQITWRRSSDANTYGTLVNKVVLDTLSVSTIYDNFAGKNIQASDNNSSGSINYTDIKFVEEKPIEIKDNMFYAPLYKNNIIDNIYFINPSSQLQTYMKFKDVSTKNESNISYINKDIWAIKIENDKKQIFSSKDDKSFINTNFVDVDSNGYITSKQEYIDSNPLPWNYDNRCITLLNVDKGNYLINIDVENVSTATDFSVLYFFNNQNIQIRQPISPFYQQGNHTIYFSSDKKQDIGLMFKLYDAKVKFDIYYLNYNIGDKYEIKTFFRSSDENQFSLYNKPEISLQILSAIGGKQPSFENGVWILDQRSFVAVADYDQSEYIQWKSYQWSLYEGDYLNSELNKNDLLKQTDVYYDKEIKYTFYGLQDTNKYYTVVLTLTDDYNQVTEKRILLHTQFHKTIVSGDGYFSYNNRCDISGVEMEFTDKQGYVLPYITDSMGNVISYLKNSEDNYNGNPKYVNYYGDSIDNSYAKILNANENIPDGLVYGNVASNKGTNPNNPANINKNLSFDENDGLYIQTKITIDTLQYDTNLISISLGNGKSMSIYFGDILKDDGFPDYKSQNRIIYNNSTPLDGTIETFIDDSYKSKIMTTDLWPSEVQDISFIQTSFLPNNIAQVNYITDLKENNASYCEIVTYKVGDKLKTFCGKILKDDNEQNAFYSFPILFSEDYKKDYSQLHGYKESVWQDNKSVDLKKVVVCYDGSDYYYCYRLVKGDNSEVIWHDTYKDKTTGEEKENIWRDGDQPLYTDLHEVLISDKDSDGNIIESCYVTDRNYLKDMTFDIFVTWNKNNGFSSMVSVADKKISLWDLDGGLRDKILNKVSKSNLPYHIYNNNDLSLVYKSKYFGILENYPNEIVVGEADGSIFLNYVQFVRDKPDQSLLSKKEVDEVLSNDNLNYSVVPTFEENSDGYLHITTHK